MENSAKSFGSYYKRQKKLLIIIASLAFVAWGCSKSDDNADNSKKTENGTEVNDSTGNGGSDISSQLTPGTDKRPDWQVPNYDNWEQTMSVMILPQRELLPYVTEKDLLCAQMNGEVRGVAEMVVDHDITFFPLTVGADGAEARIYLYYYRDSLHRIYSTDWADFNPSVVPTGESTFYRPVFVK